jgi:hypothetical protein
MLLKEIINNSLAQSQYPTVWKQEWVTPAPKISYPKVIKDLRKISGTSDFSKVFEGFLKDWIMEDVAKNIDIGQFGGQPGIGTEHLVVCLMDRILKLLDKHTDRSAVIMTCLDWSAAFDRQDPTLGIIKFIKLGVRPSLIPLLVSYLTDRRMQVKFNGELSEFLALIGGGPQGTLWAKLNTWFSQMTMLTLSHLMTGLNTLMTCQFCSCYAFQVYRYSMTSNTMEPQMLALMINSSQLILTKLKIALTILQTGLQKIR